MTVLDAEVVSDETAFEPDDLAVPATTHPTGWCNDGNHVRCPYITGGTSWPDPSDHRRKIRNPHRRCPCKCHNRDLPDL